MRFEAATLPCLQAAYIHIAAGHHHRHCYSAHQDPRGKFPALPGRHSWEPISEDCYDDSNNRWRYQIT